MLCGLVLVLYGWIDVVLMLVFELWQFWWGLLFRWLVFSCFWFSGVAGYGFMVAGLMVVGLDLLGCWVWLLDWLSCLHWVVFSDLFCEFAVVL